MRVTLFTQPSQSIPSTFRSTVSMRAIIQFQAMHRLKQLFVVLVLALAVPIQGFAAVAGGLCMALEQHHHHQDSDHTSDQPKGHDHGANGHSSCTSCVNCCASAAVADHAYHGLSGSPTAAPAAPATPAPVGLHPTPLDRPPLAL